MKNNIFSGSFGFMFKQCHPTTISQLFTKTLTGTDLGCSLGEDESNVTFCVINLYKFIFF